MNVCRALLLAGALTVVACVPAGQPGRPAPARAVPLDLAWYESATDGTVYKIDTRRSRLEIRTGRVGALMHLGHNHVIVSREVEGLVFVGSDRSRSRADVWVEVGAFVLDDPADRAAAGAGFESVPTAQDIAGTWANLTGATVLDATNHPRITARITPLDVTQGNASVSATLAVRGNAYRIPVSATWRLEGGELHVATTFEVAQTDLGITPFSALGGALRVADEIRVGVELFAGRR